MFAYVWFVNTERISSYYESAEINVAYALSTRKWFWRMIIQRRNYFPLDWVNAEWYCILITVLYFIPPQNWLSHFRVYSFCTQMIPVLTQSKRKSFLRWLRHHRNHFGAHTGTKISFMYSFSGNCAASVPISTSMCLWAIQIFPGVVHIFGCRKIDQPSLEIYKSLTDIWV